jgi:hypothetical protein
VTIQDYGKDLLSEIQRRKDITPMTKRQVVVGAITYLAAPIQYLEVWLTE